MEFVKRLVRDQKGVVESTLVIIPLMALFLITVELIVAVNYRNIDASLVQSDASMRALTSPTTSVSLMTSTSSDSVNATRNEIVIFSPRSSSQGFQIVIAHRNRTLPHFLMNFPFLSSGHVRSTDVVGVAVMERNP